MFALCIFFIFPLFYCPKNPSSDELVYSIALFFIYSQVAILKYLIFFYLFTESHANQHPSANTKKDNFYYEKLKKIALNHYFLLKSIR